MRQATPPCCKVCGATPATARFPRNVRSWCQDHQNERLRERAARLKDKWRYLGIEMRDRRPRQRDGECPAHLEWIRTLPCAVCGPARSVHRTHAAHVRQSTGGGIGLKPPDRWAVPLCPAHHREQHQLGHAGFDSKHGVCLRDLAVSLAARSPHLANQESTP